MGFRSRRREPSDGRVTGCGLFDRGHIHHILTNPIHAGRIRHKGQVYDGQYPSIIKPATWDHVQKLFSDTASTTRGYKTKGIRSPLAGKLFDETGDRLTPSHSRKNGKRLRYYICRRLVTDRSQKHPDAWRLPAVQLENLILEAVLQHLARSGAAALMVAELKASEVSTIEAALKEIMTPRKSLCQVQVAEVAPGSLTISLDAQSLSTALNAPVENLKSPELTINTPFQMRRRGVELKLQLGVAPPEVDKTLVSNIVKGRRWLEMIIAGKTFAEISEATGVPKRLVQLVTELALLSPEIQETIAAGEQTEGLTSDYLIKTGFPVVWSEQSEQFTVF